MEKVRIFQKGFNYSQDGQGNRLVYHLQGCNMECAWCANPEGMRMEGVLCTDKEWLDDTLCPRGAVQGKSLNRSMCKDCPSKECLNSKYKNKGIRLSYEEYTTEEIFEEICRSKPMFYDGGGVTFTGGEATMQYHALKELLIRLKEAGIHTAIETNGSHPKLCELFPWIDQLIMDCKHWDSEQHKRYTGVPFDMTLRNLKKAAELHGHLDIRIPLIGRVNNSEEDMRNFAMLFREIGGEHVTYEVLKYHEFGKNKWKECGWIYTMTEEAHVTVDEVRKFRNILSENGLVCKKS